MSDRISGNGQPEALPPRGTGRRRSLLILGLLLIGLPIAFITRAALDDGWRTVTSEVVLEERDVLYLPDVGVFVVDGDPPLALSARSSHLGHPVAFCPSSGSFQEVHGSHFDRRGYYLQGPAPRGLDRVATRVRGGSVEINVSIVTEGPPRGAGPPLPPEGPFCVNVGPQEAVNGFFPDPSASD